jgi:hypothetical protein
MELSRFVLLHIFLVSGVPPNVGSLIDTTALVVTGADRLDKFKHV